MKNNHFNTLLIVKKNPFTFETVKIAGISIKAFDKTDAPVPYILIKLNPLN